eukprot:2287703-Heterocapsa_arctica.AAC.1
MARGLGACQGHGKRPGWSYWQIRRRCNSHMEWALGASIGWGRKKTLHRFSIYGFDLGQKDQQGQSYYERANRSIRERLGRFVTQLGRVPWIIGGD